MSKLLPHFLLTVSLLSFSVAGFLLYSRVAPLPSTVHQSSIATQSAVRLSIPELSIDVPIIPTKIVNYRWEYTSLGVAYLESTPLPGSPGNSIFYGHNWPNILGNLPKSVPGQRVIITYSDGSQAQFSIDSTVIVKPHQTEVLNSSTDPRLTIYTCVGFLDSKRFVATAIPI